MAVGTGLSRISGLGRVVALAYALGAHRLADAFNLANTAPNMLYDIVLGGVLSATFIPIFVEHLATKSERDAWAAISAVITTAASVLVVMTIAFIFLAPFVIDAFTSLHHTGSILPAHLAQEKALATTLLRWFVPQVALYGVLSLMTALLNAKRRFIAPMWVPIANNAVCIGVLLWFHHLVPSFPSLAAVSASRRDIVLLGLGTTLGVALQAVLLAVATWRTGIGRLHWRFEPSHPAVRRVLSLGGWTFGFVVANQVALFVVLGLAVSAPGSDPVSAYSYAYTFMQVPYAVVAISVMSAITPDLAERWSTGELLAFKRRLAGGLRATMAIITPVSITMLVLAHPIVSLFLAHGSTSVADASLTGSTLGLFTIGLPGFCVYLYVIRVLQSMQRSKAAFFLYVVENGLNVVLAFALIHPMGVRGLALALSLAYSIGALVGVAVLRRWLGHLGDPGTWAPLRRVIGASVALAAVEVVVSSASSATQGMGLFVRVTGACVAGALAFGVAVYGLGARRARLDLSYSAVEHRGVGPILEQPTAAVPIVESNLRWVGGTTRRDGPDEVR